jgi:transposase-like protein
MWSPKLTMKCPVCPAILGRRDKGVATSFECAECRFIFTWDEHGVLQKPQKVLKPIKGCDCGGCSIRNS